MLNPSEVRRLIPKNGIFTVVFIKANGEQREMTCRLGVKKHLKGGTSTIKDHKNLVSVFDMKAGEYRCFDINKVVCIKTDKKVLSTVSYAESI